MKITKRLTVLPITALVSLGVHAQQREAAVCATPVLGSAVRQNVFATAGRNGMLPY